MVTGSGLPRPTTVASNRVPAPIGPSVSLIELVIRGLYRGSLRWSARTSKTTSLVSSLDSVAQVCDTKQQAELAKFLPKALDNVDGADRRIEQILESATRCAALKARESERAAKRLP